MVEILIEPGILTMIIMKLIVLFPSIGEKMRWKHPIDPNDFLEISNVNESKVNNDEKKMRNQNQNQNQNLNTNRENLLIVEEKLKVENEIFRAKPIEYSPAKTTDRVIPVDYQQDRIIYVDAPRPKPPSAATKAFVRNLSSNSVAQHMSWESESLYTERSNSDL